MMNRTSSRRLRKPAPSFETLEEIIAPTSLVGCALPTVPVHCTPCCPVVAKGCDGGYKCTQASTECHQQASTECHQQASTECHQQVPTECHQQVPMISKW